MRSGQQDRAVWVTELCKSYGLRLTLCDDCPDVGYDGKGRIQATSVSNALHDLAHYFVAAKYRRRVVNFGLGQSPDDLSGAERLVTDNYAYAEEEEASLLGILMEREAGMPFIETWDTHGWPERPVGGVKDTVPKLMKKGYVYMHGGKMHVRWPPAVQTEDE